MRGKCDQEHTVGISVEDLIDFSFRGSMLVCFCSTLKMNKLTMLLANHLIEKLR